MNNSSNSRSIGINTDNKCFCNKCTTHYSHCESNFCKMNNNIFPCCFPIHYPVCICMFFHFQNMVQNFGCNHCNGCNCDHQRVNSCHPIASHSHHSSFESSCKNCIEIKNSNYSSGCFDQVRSEENIKSADITVQSSCNICQHSDLFDKNYESKTEPSWDKKSELRSLNRNRNRRSEATVISNNETLLSRLLTPSTKQISPPPSSPRKIIQEEESEDAESENENSDEENSDSTVLENTKFKILKLAELEKRDTPRVPKASENYGIKPGFNGNPQEMNMNMLMMIQSLIKEPEGNSQLNKLLNHIGSEQKIDKGPVVTFKK